MSNMPLGDTQKSVLLSLHTHKRWYKGCGWLWTTPAATERVMQSLVKRGYAQVEVRPIEWCNRTRDCAFYSVTAAGLDALREFFPYLRRKS